LYNTNSQQHASYFLLCPVSVILKL
jgi:hypothetical protein